MSHGLQSVQTILALSHPTLKDKQKAHRCKKILGGWHSFGVAKPIVHKHSDCSKANQVDVL
eukprot:3304765-Amphidinium_carterae.1